MCRRRRNTFPRQVPPDNDPPQPMGPAGEVELSEQDHDRLVDLKSAAAALASEGKWADAVAEYTKAVKVLNSLPLRRRK